jgi:hypothetical protein
MESAPQPEPDPKQELLSRYLARRLLDMLERRLRQRFSWKKWLLGIVSSVCVLGLFGAVLLLLLKPQCPYLKTPLGEIGACTRDNSAPPPQFDGLQGDTYANRNQGFYLKVPTSGRWSVVEAGSQPRK